MEGYGFADTRISRWYEPHRKLAFAKCRAVLLCRAQVMSLSKYSLTSQVPRSSAPERVFSAMCNTRFESKEVDLHSVACGTPRGTPRGTPGTPHP